MLYKWLFVRTVLPCAPRSWSYTLCARACVCGVRVCVHASVSRLHVRFQLIVRCDVTPLGIIHLLKLLTTSLESGTVQDLKLKYTYMVDPTEYYWLQFRRNTACT